MSRAAPLFLALVSLPARAQGGPPITWETYPVFAFDGRATALAFLPGPAPDGSADTLLAGAYDGVWRYDPTTDSWANTCLCAGEDLARTSEGYLLAGAPTGGTSIDRSTDGARTWEEDVFPDGASVIFTSTLPALGGAVYSDDGARVYRSLAGGARGTWQMLGAVGGQPAALGEVPPSAALPDGRLLSGVWNGLAYSDDGGATWTPSSLWGGGRYVVTAIAFRPDPAHPYGGTAFFGGAGLRRRREPGAGVP